MTAIWKIATLAGSAILLSACSTVPDMNTAKLAADHQDYKAAMYHYESLSDFGIPQAKTELGKLYLYGRGEPQNAQKALALFEEAYRLGDGRSVPLITKARAKLGAISIRSEAGGVGPEKGLNLLKQAADENDADALLELGYAYEKGLGVKQNGTLANQYYSKASALGSGRAFHQRAQLYRNGKLVPQNTGLAIQLYQKAAENNYPRSYVELAKIYERGLGVPANPKTARNYYDLARKKGVSVQ